VDAVKQRFRNRQEAGRLLAEHLRQYAGDDDVVVLALARGGVPVAFEVACVGRLVRERHGCEALLVGFTTYQPGTERILHSFNARLGEQFDVVIHLDETHALGPLERTSQWKAGELPETYPSGA